MIEPFDDNPNKDLPVRGRRSVKSHLIFAAVVTGIAVIAIGVLLNLSPDWLDHDYQNVISYVIAIVATLIILGRLCLRTQIPLTVKIIAPVVLLGLPVLLFRPDEFDGDMRFNFVPRFAARPDELLEVPDVDADHDEMLVDLAATTPDDYPRFLGADGRATLRGLHLRTDWKQQAPRLIWRQPIGAGWSAFSIVGRWAVTQEQRGDKELVTCYDTHTGDLMWLHSDPVRFSETLGGVGPRATPTIDEGRVYTQGATGILNCLNGATGERLWSRNIITENNADQIEWGRSGSPLIEGDMVIVSAGGSDGKSLVAYDKKTGDPIWSAGSDRASYASPVATTLAGVRQIVTVNEDWVVGHRAQDGEVLWKHGWPSGSDTDAATSQPVPIDDNRLFLSRGYGHGCALIKIERAAAKADLPFAARELWSSSRLMKTKMTNVVIHDGHVYGLSGGILECIDLTDPKRRWKRGRYGHGQIMLVEDLIVVLSEKGELVLVDATPDRFRERASMSVLEGKTWNNPAISGRLLLIRNHREAACYELPIRAE